MRRTSLVVAALVGLASLGTVTPARADGTGVLEGTVTDARTGAPISGAFISLVRTGGYAPYAQTDASGHWSLEVIEDTYKIDVLSFSGLYREQWAVGQADEASATPYVVTGGSDTVVNVGLQPYPSVSGRITDTHGAPVVGFCPALVEGDPAAGNSYGGPCSDADGNYTVGTVVNGTYRLHFRDYLKPYADQWYRGAVNADDARTFKMADDTFLTGYDVVLQPEATIATAITDSNGVLLHGCVTAFDLKGRYAGNGCTEYDTPAPVTVTQLPAGTYVLQAEERGQGPHVKRYLGGTTTPKGATRITVTTGQAVSAPAVVLPLGGSVTGLVRDAATGAPIVNACVSTTGRYDAREGHGYGGEEPGLACTDDTGRYTVSALESGSYPLEVADTFGTHANLFFPSFPDSRGAKTYKVTLGAATTVPDALLVEGGSITGRVTLADGASPAYTCLVAYAAATHEQIGRVGCASEDGTYTITGLGTNSYKVEAYGVPEGYQAVFAPGTTDYKKAATVTVTAGATTGGVNLTAPRS